MTINITVKVKFGANKEDIEKFGSNKYLIHLIEPEGEKGNMLLLMKLSRYLGVPPSKIVFVGFDPHKDRIFEVL